MKKAKLTERFGVKLLAWFLLALSVLCMMASAVGIYAAWEEGAYSCASAEELKRTQFDYIVGNTGFELARRVVTDDKTQYADALAQQTNAEYRVLDPDGTEKWKSAGYDAIADSPYSYTHVFRQVTLENGGCYYNYFIDTLGGERGYTEPAPVPTEMPTRTRNAEPTPEPTAAPTDSPRSKPVPTPLPTVTPTPAPAQAPVPAAEAPAAAETETLDYLLEAVIDPSLPLRDDYYWMGLGMDLLWAMRFGVYVLAGLSLLLGVLCYVFLLCAAGHRAGRDGLTPGHLTRVPFDLLTAVTGLLCAVIAWQADEAAGTVHSFLIVPLACAALLALSLLFTGWSTSLALRVKLGKWWENTIVYRLLRLLWRALRATFRVPVALVRQLPLVWRTCLLILAVSFVELLVYFGLHLWRNTFAFFLLWLLEKLLLGGAALWLALILRRLQNGGAALAAGDLRYQTDTRAMPGEFRRHGEHLNSIAAGMEAAVERQMRSERMKTELITNVSHDVKTPLTSIINYIDLLKTADDPAQRAEYLAVLDRQSRKLKKLTEDLVEVSKASTGNVEVAVARHSVSELLKQAAGEYSERLEAAGLEAVLTLPEAELFAALDGRLMWRVLDNLLSNVCKYAQSGTRFYIDAVLQNGSVVMRFKNVSRDPLNVSAEELMERFVRGDSARSGEGSGLGLSIARSLTELQGGVFALSVDGDLFKAELAFPAA